MEAITKNASATQSLGRKIGAGLKGGEVLALYGDLGSGKTTFVQGLAKGLGIKRRILSPTFVLIRQHPVKDKILYHVDLYRIEKAEEARGLGLEEILADPQAVVVIEWAEKMKELLPKKRTDIYFKYLAENSRQIKIKE